MKYVSEYFFFTFSEVRIIVIRMRARMNDSIHVQVHIIKVGYLKLNKTEKKNLTHPLSQISDTVRRSAIAHCSCT